MRDPRAALRERRSDQLVGLALFVATVVVVNATSEQMRMFLTRLGFGSKAVVTGDVTQTDLPPGARPGLKEAEELLSGIDGISCCRFSDADVVRHPLVQKIVVAYERSDQRRADAQQLRSRSPRNDAPSGPGEQAPD